MKIQTPRYLVFLCPRCGSARYSKSEQKTARCFKCGYQILIDPLRIQIISKTNKRTEAMETVKKHKMKLAEKFKK